MALRVFIFSATIATSHFQPGLEFLFGFSVLVDGNQGVRHACQASTLSRCCTSAPRLARLVILHKLYHGTLTAPSFRLPSVAEHDLQLIDLPTSTIRVLGWKACVTVPGLCATGGKTLCYMMHSATELRPQPVPCFLKLAHNIVCIHHILFKTHIIWIYLSVCMPTTYVQEPSEGGLECPGLLDLSNRWLWKAMWMWRIKIWSTARASNSPKNWAIFLAPVHHI